MGIAKLQAGIKWICSNCRNIIPNGEGLSINKKPYCESCGEIMFRKFEKDIEELKIKKEEK